ADNSAACVIKGEVDSISSLPDVILQHILFSFETKFAIRTSVLSKRWRHVWCNIPSLSFDNIKEADAINKALAKYTAPKMMDFHLKINKNNNVHHIKKWIEFAMSRNVENMSLDVLFRCKNIPRFSDINSYFKPLNHKLDFSDVIPGHGMSWTSLKKLSLRYCGLPDESAKILSGCPILECLTLYHCRKLNVLDLSKSLRLRTLEISSHIMIPGPTQIVAPHIHCLKLRNTQLPCTLVDVSSLTEAEVLDIIIFPLNMSLKADFLYARMLEMLKKLENLEKLTFSGGSLQNLSSIVEKRGVPFPMFKVKALTLEMEHFVISDIERMLQNSPNLKKLTVRAKDNTRQGKYLDRHFTRLESGSMLEIKKGV
ncbi:F-box domain, partial [Arabidopsis suecica]